MVVCDGIARSGTAYAQVVNKRYNMNILGLGFEKVGVIGVDAGCCWIGDPCYVIHKRADAPEEHDRPPKDIGNNWGEFCDVLDKRGYYGKPPDMVIKDGQVSWEGSISPLGHLQFNYDMGHPGLGVLVETGYGDGSYSVFVKKNGEGRIMQVLIDFEGLDENDCDIDEDE